MKESTQVRNHSAAHIVSTDVTNQMLWRFMKGSTLMRNPSAVGSVTRHSELLANWLNMKESTSIDVTTHLLTKPKCYKIFFSHIIIEIDTVTRHMFWLFCSKGTLLFALLDVFALAKNKWKIWDELLWFGKQFAGPTFCNHSH